MRSLPRRPSPALVISIIALVVAMAGTGYAAIKLPKNSVGTRELKKNAVTGAKVKDHSLTGSDLSLGKLGTVPSAADAAHAAAADNATNAGHATSADNATNAGHATSADSATSAAKATDADTVGGVAVKGFSYITPSSAAKATLFSMNGLTLTAACVSGRLDAKTSADHAYISAEWIGPGATPYVVSDTDFNQIETFAANPVTGLLTGTIEYVRPDGQRVSVDVQADMAAACTVSGHALGSG